MNAFCHINKILGLCFALAVVGIGVYKGLEAFDRGKRDMVRKGKKEFLKRIEASADDMPPGLNGEYPADGPLAEHYRRNPTVGGGWVPVGP